MGAIRSFNYRAERSAVAEHPGAEADTPNLFPVDGVSPRQCSQNWNETAVRRGGEAPPNRRLSDDHDLPEGGAGTENERPSTAPGIRKNLVAGIDTIIRTLEVDVSRLCEHTVASDRPHLAPTTNNTAIFYITQGTGSVFRGSLLLARLRPHSLVVLPPKCALSIVVPREAAHRTVLLEGQTSPRGQQTSYEVAPHDPEGDDLKLLYASFSASYGFAVDVFEPLKMPIVEDFVSDDMIGQRLSLALTEYSSDDVGREVATRTLLQQIIITLLRRSLTSNNCWVERFALASDPQILKAFMTLVARPGEHHTVESLCKNVGLSRSAFMQRFSDVVGQSPMAILRELRLRRASALLDSRQFSVDQVAYKLGYRSRSSFIRALRKRSAAGSVLNQASSAIEL